MQNTKLDLLWLIIVLVLISYLSVSNNTKDNIIIKNNIKHKKELQIKDSIIKYQQKRIDTLNTIISVAHNSQVLFENIVGVKEPDGIITYKEKCLVTADRIHKLNRYKFN